MKQGPFSDWRPALEVSFFTAQLFESRGKPRHGCCLRPSKVWARTGSPEIELANQYGWLITIGQVNPIVFNH